MNFKKISLLIVLLLIADQALKIWIKTHMHLEKTCFIICLYHDETFQDLYLIKMLEMLPLDTVTQCILASEQSI